MTDSEALESLALKLKNARKSKRLTVAKLAKIIALPEQTIEAMENPGSMDLPMANLVGLANRYAAEVGLGKSKIAEEISVLRPRPNTKTKKSTRVPTTNMFVASRASVVAVAVVVLTIVLGYAGWQAWQLTAAPKLIVGAPQDYSVIDKPEVKVSGKSSPDSSVLVNGSNVSLAEDGSFETVVYMQPGQNFVQIRAINALGHEAVKDKVVIFTP